MVLKTLKKRENRKKVFLIGMIPIGLLILIIISTLRPPAGIVVNRRGTPPLPTVSVTHVSTTEQIGVGGECPVEAWHGHQDYIVRVEVTGSTSVDPNNANNIRLVRLTLSGTTSTAHRVYVFPNTLHPMGYIATISSTNIVGYELIASYLDTASTLKSHTLSASILFHNAIDFKLWGTVGDTGTNVVFLELISSVVETTTITSTPTITSTTLPATQPPAFTSPINGFEIIILFITIPVMIKLRKRDE